MGFGRFNRVSRQASAAPMSEINMTPLIDVMLVLLVIFMLAVPLLSSRISLNLPKSAAAKPVAEAQPLSVSLDGAGRIYLNDKPMSQAELVQALRELAPAQTGGTQAEVQLRAERSVPYGQVLSLMGAIEQAGYARVGLVAQP